ncbi:unnamed protein product [Cyprideis torosa]|uniref:Uncharacterized protein n=1 Tax=Cyprideis torosa TaxID=163714 RepID=A0A7R8WGI1_9CRUS|nr:unnamed protein product [Cyprideis torosa]CAG0892646.1 unnamed protein product [Cyprideis torosa]
MKLRSSPLSQTPPNFPVIPGVSKGVPAPKSPRRRSSGSSSQGNSVYPPASIPEEKEKEAKESNPTVESVAKQTEEVFQMDE